MATLHRFALLCLITATAYAGISAGATSVKLQVRLQNHLTSYRSRTGSPFECVVISPFEINHQVLIPVGSLVYGRVKRALPVRLGVRRERASLELSFESYKTPDGHTFPLSAKLASIDNAREEVTASGRIKGVIAADNPEEMLNGIWEKPSVAMLYRPLEGVLGVSHQILERYPMTPVGPAVLLGVRCLLLRFPEPEIHLPPGTDMNLTVDRVMTGFAPHPAPPIPAAPEELEKWLDGQPRGIEKANGTDAGDLINIAFLGSWQELADAFYSSGWYPADPRTLRSFSHVYQAFNGKKNYFTAPVSKMFYQGKPPEITFEKSLDTVTKRHHVRIWKAGTFEGREVWLGAATHDTGIGFNTARFRFTHRIDKNVDDERAKVAVDLTFTGCSQTPEFAASDPARSQDSSVVTDGRVAVLSLQPCRPMPAVDAGPAPRPPGNPVSRLARRIILETRSYLIRENAYYWTYQMIRYRWQARHTE